MKKLIMFFAVLVCFSFAGCGSAEAEKPEESEIYSEVYSEESEAMSEEASVDIAEIYMEKYGISRESASLIDPEGGNACRIKSVGFYRSENSWMLNNMTFYEDGESGELVCDNYHRAIAGATVIGRFRYEGVCLLIDGRESREKYNEMVLYDGCKVTVIAENGESKTYTIRLKTPEYDLPVISIRRINTSVDFSRDFYIKSNITYINGGKTVDLGSASIKIRGNSTSGFEKKPYRIKFGYPVEFGDMGEYKNWVLLANYTDKSLIHTDIATYMANSLTETDYVPAMQQVVVYVDGEYMGLYDLGHQVEVAEGKVELGNTEITETGFFIEIDARYEEEGYELGKNCFMVGNSYFCIKEPTEITPEMFEYIKEYVYEVNRRISSHDDSVSELIDIDSFVNWFIVNEFSTNSDCAMFLSVFMYKNSEGKLKIGPIWDFDLAFGNYKAANNEKGEGWFIKHSLWWNDLCDTDVFEAALLEKWNFFSESVIPGIYDLIDYSQKYLEYEYEQNFKKWKILGVYVWDNPDSVANADTMEKQYEVLRTHIANRKIWMDKNINRICTD